MMTLLALSARFILQVAYAPYRGGFGERSLLKPLIQMTCIPNLLFLLDAGLYSFEILYLISQKNADLISKVPSHLKLKPIKIYEDGSYLAELTGKISDHEAAKRKDGKKSWKHLTVTVRVVFFEIRGFRPVRLITTILDLSISAREIVLHYHQRWDIEIAYDEIKTHQCATLRGQSPTTFRSKRPDLVAQELFAMIIMYNVTRLLIWQAATKHQLDPLEISFLDVLQHLIDAAPIISTTDLNIRAEKPRFLYQLIADCQIDRPRRGRVNPRVVKVKMSKYRRKKKSDQSMERDFANELIILAVPKEPNNIIQFPIPPKHANVRLPPPQISFAQAA